MSFNFWNFGLWNYWTLEVIENLILCKINESIFFSYFSHMRKKTPFCINLRTKISLIIICFNLKINFSECVKIVKISLERERDRDKENKIKTIIVLQVGFTLMS